MSRTAPTSFEARRPTPPQESGGITVLGFMSVSLGPFGLPSATLPISGPAGRMSCLKPTSL